jgi:hypothetical protein
MMKLIYCMLICLVNTSVFAQSFIQSSTNNYAGLIPDHKQAYDDIVNLGIYKNITFITMGTFGDVYANNEIQIDFPLIADTNLVFVTDDANIDDPNNQYFYGKIIQDIDSFTHNHGTLLLSRYNGSWSGTLKYNTKTFDIYDLGGGINIIAELDYDLPYMDSIYCNQMEVETDDGPTVFTETDLAWDCNRIRTKVLFLYTSQLTNNHGLVSNKVANAIIHNNHVWHNSKINNKLELAGVAKINFTLTTNERIDVNNLSSDPIVQTLRDNYEADIVVLFIPDNQYGYLKGETKYVANKVAKYQDAYALVSFGLSVSEQVFTHEVGHIYGGRHQKPIDNTNDIHHAHEFYDKYWWRNNNKRKYYWTTISQMNLNPGEKEKIRIDYISNPDVKFAGKYTGHDSINNALILNNNKHTVAGFYTDGPQPTVTISMSNADCDPDGTATANIYCAGDNTFTYSWSVPVSGAPGVWMNVVGGNGPTINTYTTVPNSGINSKLYRVTVHDGTNYYYAQKYTSVYCTYLNPTGGPMVETAKETPANSTLLFPNPVKDNINLAFELDKEEAFAINIYDINGRLIKNIHQGGLAKGKHAIQHDIASLADGIYILKFESKHINYQEKFQKIN